MAYNDPNDAQILSALEKLPNKQKGTLSRWRLILGQKSEHQGITGQGAEFAGMFGEGMEGMDAAGGAEGEGTEGMDAAGGAEGEGVEGMDAAGGAEGEGVEGMDAAGGAAGEGMDGMGAGGGARGGKKAGTRGKQKKIARKAIDSRMGGRARAGKKALKKPGSGQSGRGMERPGAPGRERGDGSRADASNRFNDIDNTLNFVYQSGPQERSAGLSSSGLTIPKWIENVKEFFPNQAKLILEKDLIKKSNIADLVRHPELFEKVEPSIDMVKTIISLKHMLPEDVKAVARKIVKKVVEDLQEKLKSEVERHIVGAIKRSMHTPIKIFRNIDWRQSIRKNMKNYDASRKKLIMAEPKFFSNEKTKKPWQIIVLVDESGSMTDSLIYAVVMASIFTSLPALHTNLVIFDTRYVDLSDKASDPVDILMNVQLGGGTDITGAVRYGRSLIKNAKKCVMIVISDFFEGRPGHDLISEFKLVLEGETKVLGLAAIGSDARPIFNSPLAKEMNKIGIDVLASTPENLAEIIGKLMK